MVSEEDREEIFRRVEHCVPLLVDEDPSIRAGAAREIGGWSNRIYDMDCREFEVVMAEAVETVASLATDDDPEVRKAVAYCFFELAWPDTGRLFQALPRHEVMTPLISLLGDDDEGVRRGAAWAFSSAAYGKIPVGRLLERAIEPLIGIIGGEDSPETKKHAIEAIGSIAWSQTATTTEPFVMPLIEVLRTDASAEVRARAAKVARKFNEDERIIEQLIASLEDDVAEVRCAAADSLVEGLWELGSPSALDVNPMIMEPILSALLGDLEDDGEDIRKSVIGSLVEIEDERALEAVSDAVKNDPSQSVREYAAWAIEVSVD
jgi:HEAT repeat protein